MTTVASIESQAAAPGAMSPTRPLYWSVWRELWENRSLYIAPILVAGVQVIGFAISTVGLAERRREVLLLDPALQRARIEVPYDRGNDDDFYRVHRGRVLLPRRAPR